MGIGGGLMRTGGSGSLLNDNTELQGPAAHPLRLPGRLAEEYFTLAFISAFLIRGQERRVTST